MSLWSTAQVNFDDEFISTVMHYQFFPATRLVKSMQQIRKYDSSRLRSKAALMMGNPEAEWGYRGPNVSLQHKHLLIVIINISNDWQYNDIMLGYIDAYQMMGKAHPGKPR